ncbi:MAG: TerB family tellurite resistance protein [Paracoccaceae bacterium]
MIEAFLRKLLAPHPAPLSQFDARLALAALLVRVARTDGDYAAVEVARIDAVLCSLYPLSQTEVAALRNDAEDLEAGAPDTVRFTRAIKEAVAHSERQSLMQALWSVALADGSRANEEDQVLRLVDHILGLTDVESAHARRAAQS